MPILGLDLGGTKTAFCAGEETGPLRARDTQPTQSTGDAEADLAELIARAQRFWQAAQAETEGAAPKGAVAAPGAPPSAIGLSVPGPIDARRGLLLNPPNLPGWRDVPMVSAFEAAFSCPVRLENDANAAALAEWRFGAGQGTQDMLYLTMSTGIGSGLVLGGRLHRGAAGDAGEAGHAPIHPGGRLCACGLRGCLEAYCGGIAWQAQLREQTPDGSQVLALADGNRQGIRPEHLVAAAKAGDAFALTAFDEWLEHLSIGLAQLVMTLAPERIVLGTIAVAAGEALCFEPLRRKVRARIWGGLADGLEIVPAGLGGELPFEAGRAAALGLGLGTEPGAGRA